MANAITTKNEFRVHGRGSLTEPFEVFDKDSDGFVTQRDISAHTIYFEVKGAGIRNLLVANPGDALGLMIQLTEDDVEALETTALKYAIRDETVDSFPVVLNEGTIRRAGYTGAP